MNSSLDRVHINWRKHILNPSASVHVDAISETISMVLDEMLAFTPAAIDFRDFNADQVNGEHLAAALRAVNCWRNKGILGWDAGLDIAAEALGELKDDALYGLVHEPK